MGAYRNVGEALGATVKANTSVTSVKVNEQRVEVETSTETYTAKHLIVATGE